MYPNPVKGPLTLQGIFSDSVIFKIHQFFKKIKQNHSHINIIQDQKSVFISICVSKYM